MQQILDALGKPFQARAVPEAIERLTRGQVLLLHEILRRRMRWIEHGIVISYFQGARKDSAGLPLYAFIAEGHGMASDVPTTLKTRFLQPLLNRYRGRAEIGEVREQAGVLSYQWGMWLEEDMTSRFLSQQLPLFAESNFDGFVEYRMQTKQPLYATQYQLLREKGEASGALLYLNPVSEYSMLLGFPAVAHTTHGLLVPEPQRFEYVASLLAPWDPYRIDHEKEVNGDAAEILERVGKPALVMEPATPVFVQARYASAKGPFQGQEHPLTQDEVEAVLGKPHARLLESGTPIGEAKVARYAYTIRDALVVVEARQDFARIYYFPGEEPTAILFEEFCRILTG